MLTGAGVSAESGVPTFRGPDGLWGQYRAEDLAIPRAFRQDPRLVWEWYDWRRQLIARCAPNPAHAAIAWLERQVPEFLLVTQNVDGLHRRAGSVEPAASLPQVAQEHGAYAVEVNLEPTPLSGIADEAHHGKAGELLPRLLGLSLSPGPQPLSPA